MGCRSDYMEPNERESESVLVCQLTKYLFTALGVVVPPHVMSSDYYYGSLATLDTDTAVLCSTIQELNKEQLDRIVYDGHNADARKLAAWWDQHQEADRKREEKEKEEKARNKTIERALKKLTLAEREALGFK